MSDRRKHRGAHPEDRSLFGPRALPELQAATADLSWLLTRGYSSVAALKLVGDRHGLNRRQQVAVQRCACSDGQKQNRGARRVEIDELEGQHLHLDGFNLLVTLEAALAGGVVLHARDGCFRDMASVHGTYRKVEETVPAIRLVGNFLEPLGPRRCTWYLDRPVGNSGRLAAVIRAEAERFGWPWEVEIVASPDRILKDADGVVATADSCILDGAEPWVNLARALVETGVEGVWIADLSG